MAISSKHKINNAESIIDNTSRLMVLLPIKLFLTLAQTRLFSVVNTPNDDLAISSEGVFKESRMIELKLIFNSASFNIKLL